MFPYLGELAALGTSLCFTTGSVFFTRASRLVGALVLNRTRLLVALILLALAHQFILGAPYPTQSGVQHWFWLGLSGIVGLALGDVFLFQGFSWIGPRLTMLMMSLSPLLSTLLAWIFLKERLNTWQVAAIAITLTGIAWVVMNKNGNTGQAVQNGRYFAGLLAGLGASICQAAGLVLARQGLSDGLSPLSANFIRILVAAAAIWLLAFFQGRARATWQSLRLNPSAGINIFLGAFMGPFLGVSLSLVALQHIEVGIASTLSSLPPVFLLPVSYIVFKERYGWQVIAGTLLAIAGSALLFLV